jgi:hypothetical protein
MRGEQSSTLGPLKQQRDMQRQKLVNSLREQLGPGAETSTAGMQALTKFDTETSNVFAGAQQQAISNLGQTFGQFNSGRPDILRENQGLAGLGQQRADLSFQQANALQRYGAPLLDTAGAQFVGDQMKGNYQQAAGGSIAGAGAQMFGAGGGLAGMSNPFKGWNNPFGSGGSQLPTMQQNYSKFGSNAAA